jgi:hypothetical protein
VNVNAIQTQQFSYTLKTNEADNIAFACRCHKKTYNHVPPHSGIEGGKNIIIAM